MKPLPIMPGFGQELRGLDPRDQDAVAAADLSGLLARHGLLLLRGETMAPEQQIAFSRHFGALECHAGYPAPLRHPAYDELLVVKRYNLEGHSLRFGGQWHSDLSYTLSPSRASVLHAVAVPETGGDTLFADCASAYDALSPALRARLEGLWTVHDLANGRQYGGAPPDAIAAMRANHPPVEQPLVRRHPETGRPSLFISEWMTRQVVGMSEDESLALLGPLLFQLERPAFVYRHRWQAGDTLIWDNRSTNHLAMDDYAGERTMHRCSIVGEACGRALQAPPVAA